MTLYAVVYDNGQWYEDYEESTEGIFSTREKAQAWIDAHPIDTTSKYHPRREIVEYELDTATDASVFTF